jgi:hypothetical protein
MHARDLTLRSVTALFLVATRAIDAQSVAFAPSPRGVPLFSGGRAAPIHVSAADHRGVLRVAGDLRLDVGRVTGVEPNLVVDGTPTARAVVIVGTLGRSSIVDRLVRERKLDVSAVAGRWETWVTQTVDQPFTGVDRALVIAGSDQRGTIFGVYDLSARIGVSPWYWWADVPVTRRTQLFVLPGRHTQGSPAVRYRGIFINDEAPALSGWARKTFGGFNHQFYARVFELILRLKGNYLWPAMWGSAFAMDDTLSPRVAEEYGIVMGTSHHEPMTRAHAEWAKFGSGPWNYEQNDARLRAFWREGIERLGGREHIVTLGMRGDGDMPMTEGSNIALLERIVADQRKIIGEVTRKDPPATPQVWALYKEVQDYYDKGMRVPDDVTLLFADDNWGNLRRLPSAADRARPGGAGVYYHFDYVGGPRNYKWINTNPIARVWEQMHLAYRHGADRIWIVNVGDIKPMEFPTQFFLDFAWNPEVIPAERLAAYTERWAAQQFGSTNASEIGAILTEYGRLISRRKPELLDTATYNIVNYREAQRVMDDWIRLVERAERTRNELPEETQDAYYQLVRHPIMAAANLTELHYKAALNRLYARQGRTATNDIAEQVRYLFGRDEEITRYYNDSLAGGKWAHLMDQTHIGYTYWQEPPRNVMPRVDLIQVPVAGELAVAWEGQPAPGPPSQGPRQEAALPEFDSYNQQRSWIDVYNRGQRPIDYHVEIGQPWVLVSLPNGSLAKEERLWVTVDWARVPVGVHRVPIHVSGSDGQRFTIHAPVRHAPLPAGALAAFHEGNGYVSMEAEHYTRVVNASDAMWQRIPGLGRTLSGMTPFPVTAASRTPGGDAPRLEYRLHLVSSGDVTVRAYLSPTLDFNGGEGMRYAVSFDDEPPQIVNIHADGSSSGRTDANRAWEQSVADNIKITTSRHTIRGPGVHVLKIWMVDPGVVLQKVVVDLGGLRPSYLGPPERARSP